jgi:hypothetical protein
MNNEERLAVKVRNFLTVAIVVSIIFGSVFWGLGALMDSYEKTRALRAMDQAITAERTIRADAAIRDAQIKEHPDAKWVIWIPEGLRGQKIWADKIDLSSGSVYV